MKKIVTLLVCTLMLLSILPLSALADEGITPYYNNIALKDTHFEIDSNGTAAVRATFRGDRNVITSATVKIKIQKKFLFFFWTDVIEWTDETTENNYTVVHSTTVDSGTYNAIVEYTIRGVGGESDIIKDEIERTH